MGRRAYNVQWALPELVLDLPLYSASMEHMADRCGHPISGFGSNMAAISSQTSTGIRGIQMKGGYSTMPRWTFEPIYNGRYTYSYFFSDGGNNGHGWAWECHTDGGDVRTVDLASATSFGGNHGRFFVGLSGYGGASYSMRDSGLHFVTAVIDGAHICLYMDGLLCAYGNKLKSRAFNCVGLRWTVADSGNSSAAVFRQFKLFRKVLSSTEVAALYEAEWQSLRTNG